jgi:DNA-binding transcriptional MerR regulator
MLISKKDLLAITGISYGQLYRWKRERLIPEEWFIKKSSYTGQETFFPREQILSRIQSIQELKDRYSLEELAKMLSPEVVNQSYDFEIVEEIDEIDKSLIGIYQNAFAKDKITYLDLVIMIILSELKKELGLDSMVVGKLIMGVRDQLNKIKTTGYQYNILKLDNEYYSMLANDAAIFYDSRFDHIKTVRIDEVSNRIKLKYKNNYQF